MKKIIIISLLLVTNFIFAQSKMITKTGKIVFEASVPAFEEVKAKNETVTCILNTKNGEIASLALIKGFHFKVALMEEHFNENYLESDKYKKATLKGKIEKFDVKDLTDVAKDYNLKAKLDLHGKSKEITTVLKIRRTVQGIEIISNFTVNTDDFDIKIPNLVKNKLTKTVTIKSEFLLVK